MIKRRNIFAFAYILLLTIACMLLAMEGTEAATYNFFFNNTEQGPNSTATPSVTVQDGKLVKNPGAAGDGEAPAGDATGAAPSPGGEENPPAAPAPAPESVSEVAALERTFPDAKWKISLGGASPSYGSSSDAQYWQTSERTTKLQASLTYYIIPELGASLLAGRLTGLELEVAPLRTRTGWGKLQLAFTAGALRDQTGFRTSAWGTLVPVSSMQQSMGSYFRAQSSPTHEVKPINFYAGAQLGLNVVRDLALTFAYRTSPVARYGRKLSTSTLALNYLF